MTTSFKHDASKLGSSHWTCRGSNAVTPIMLCRYCQKIRPPHNPPNSESDEHDHWCLTKHCGTFDELLASADHGCELCAVFRPFVDSAKLNRAQCSEDELGYPHSDPFGNSFEVEKEDRIDAPADIFIYRTHDLVYLDEGHQYCLLDNRLDEKNNALVAQLSQRAEEETREDLGAGFPPRPSSPERNETIQWLLQDPNKYTGPEQLWVKSWMFVGNREDNANLQERTSFFSLTAGSFEEITSAKRHLEYCVDDRVIATREAEMALQYPGLWAHRFDPLHIKQERPKNDLRPVFEFVPEDSADSLKAKRVPSDPRSAFPLIKHWLSTCVKNHKRCERGYSAAPTRLIRVLTEDGTPTVQLVDSLDLMINEQIFDIEWAILSHSWGSDRSLISTLQLANMERMLQKIDESMLCPSFQDAITITRGLSLRFIWIDAMCIIQDSPEDWNAESSRMSEYYQGSQIMISALASSSAADRMLFTRDHGPLATVVVDERRLGVRRLLENAVNVTPYLHYYWSPRDSISNQPLSNRAWTFQEYTMAPRMIHFTRDQIIWHCTTCLASEDNQYNMSDNELPETPIEKARKHKEAQSQQGKKEERRPFTLKKIGWYDIVETYTSRSITYTADILPALSAIAQQVQGFTPLTYCAGLWKGNQNTFCYNLIWETEKRHADPVRAYNGSPSWSWSSIRGKISFPFWQGSFRIAQPHNPQILGISVSLSSEKSPFGRVEQGIIDLIGWHHVYTGTATFASFHTSRRGRRFEKNDNRERRSRDHNQYLNPIPNLSALDISEIEERYWDEKQLAEAYGVGELDIPEEEPEWEQANHIILFISEYRNFSDPDEDDEDTTQFFLILKRQVTTDGSAAYARVGVGSTSDESTLDISTEHGWTKERIQIL